MGARMSDHANQLVERAFRLAEIFELNEAQRKILQEEIWDSFSEGMDHASEIWSQPIKEAL
jgi:hypothetical protein